MERLFNRWPTDSLIISLVFFLSLFFFFLLWALSQYCSFFSISSLFPTAVNLKKANLPACFLLPSSCTLLLVFMLITNLSICSHSHLLFSFLPSLPPSLPGKSFWCATCAWLFGARTHTLTHTVLACCCHSIMWPKLTNLRPECLINQTSTASANRRSCWCLFLSVLATALCVFASACVRGSVPSLPGEGPGLVQLCLSCTQCSADNSCWRMHCS